MSEQAHEAALGAAHSSIGDAIGEWEHDVNVAVRILTQSAELSDPAKRAFRVAIQGHWRATLAALSEAQGCVMRVEVM